MTIYLIDENTNEIKQTFDNVKSWDMNYVIYDNGGYLGKVYCDTETEFFTDNHKEEQDENIN